MKEEPECQYQPESWSDWVHRYINAKSGVEIEPLLKNLNLSWLQIWTQGLIDEFKDHFEPRLRKLDPDGDEWKFIVEVKWPYIGTILAQSGQYKWARLVFKKEYAMLCRLQELKGRIHKGTPLHQIGWAELVEGTPESIVRSKYFHKLALIEDYLTVGSKYNSRPAFRALRADHYLDESVVSNLITSVEKWVRREHLAVERSRPEFIYLDIVRDSGNSEEADYFHFNPDIAMHLLKGLNHGSATTNR